jgi:two-component system, NtrC family, response regulator AtoC
MIWEPKGHGASGTTSEGSAPALPESDSLSLLEIGRRAAMQAERIAIERVLNETRWNRRQAAKILKVSYKALLNKMKVMAEQDRINKNTVNTK